MVRYLDSEGHPEEAQTRRKSRPSPVEHLQHLKERSNALEGAAAIEGVRELALRLLNTYLCPMGELRRAIESKGFSAETAEEAIIRLRRVGLIDDAVSARALVSDRFTGSSKVGRALAGEIRRKGLGLKTIEAAMETLEPDDLRQRVLELARKRLRTMSQVPRDATFCRLVGMPACKGYLSSICIAVVIQVLEKREEE